MPIVPSWTTAARIPAPIRGPTVFDPLAAEPAQRTGILIGEQKLDRRVDALAAAGDTLVMPSLDRYGRSLEDPVDMAGELRRREIGFCSLHERLDATTPGGRLVSHVFAALAEFIRELMCGIP